MKKMKGYIYVIMSAVIFGLMPLGSIFLYGKGSNAITVSFYRFFFSLPLLYYLSKRDSQSEMNLDRKQYKELFILSIGFISTPLLLLTSYNFISSGMATTIHFIYPIIVLFSCIILFKEKISLIKGLSSFLCLVGLIMLCGKSESFSYAGFLIALASGFTYAFYVIFFSKGNLCELGSYRVAFYVSMIGSIVLFLVAIVTRRLVFNFNYKVWIFIILYANVTSALGSILFLKGTLLIGPQNASLLSTFEPLTSVLVGIIFLNEKIKMLSLMGIGLILISVTVLTIGDIRGIRSDYKVEDISSTEINNSM